jgi:hypothetical protein
MRLEYAAMKKSLLLLATLTLSLAAYAGGKASTAPGKYKDWGPDIDEVEIVKSFRIADYDRIAVQPFDTSKVALPDAKAKWYGTLKMALSSYDDAFIEAFKKELKAKAAVEESAHAPKTAKTLILRGTVLELDPGSRAGRYFGGFGAGAASSKLKGELVDASTGNVLVRFTQARRSGGTWKPAGGSDLEVMRDSIHATAKDVAHLIDAF